MRAVVPNEYHRLMQGGRLSEARLTVDGEHLGGDTGERIRRHKADDVDDGIRSCHAPRRRG